MNNSPAEPPKVFRRHHLLALAPLLALLLAPYIANRLEPRILGMPFLLGWIVIWVLITSLVMFVILRLDGDVLDADTFDRDALDRETVSRQTRDRGRPQHATPNSSAIDGDR